MGHDAFISYSSNDKQIAEKLCSELERGGIACWIAPRNIVGGIPYGEAIITALNESHVLILVFSSNSNSSPHVQSEIERALNKRLPIIPFRVEQTKPSAEMEFYLSRLHFVDAWTPPLEQHLPKLVEAVEDRLPKLEDRRASKEHNATDTSPIQQPKPESSTVEISSGGRAVQRAPRYECEVAIAWKPEYQNLIRTIREWLAQGDKRLPRGITLEAPAFADLSAALGSVRKQPDNAVLITLGIGRAEIERALHADEANRLEIISVLSRPQGPGKAVPSASLLEPFNFFAGPDPIPALRKSILRLSTRQYCSIWCLQTAQEIRDYFSLRYSVWKDMGYLPEEKDSIGTEWEVDYTDRTAFPIGAFSASGQLIGCARLVGGVGEEDPRLVSLIEKVLNERGDPILQKNFGYPPQIIHPFDVLAAFNHFREYYRRLVIDHVPKAEVSRVIVSPKYRKSGLGEVIVDSLISMAQRKQVQVLFLACQTKHQPFYEQCGFHLIPEMQCDSFVNVKKPSIAMERHIGRTR